jgi:hypothetical protein
MGKLNAIKSVPSAREAEKFKEKINKVLQGTSTDANTTRISDTSSDLVDASGPIVISAAVTTATPTSASAGTDTVITITGSGFGTKVSRDSLADIEFIYKHDETNVGFIYASGWPFLSVNSDDILSWTDTQIRVKVPTGITSDLYHGSASSGFLVVLTDSGEESPAVPFAVTFAYGKEKWSTPVTYFVNPGSISGAETAVQNAAATWNNAIPDSSFRFNYGGLSTCTTFGKDTRSLIYFGPESDFSDNPDVIAWATHWTSGGTIIEADIEFNSNWTWTTGTASGDTQNVEAVVLHEQGHWLVLLDLYGHLPEVGYPGFPSDNSPEKKVMFGIKDDLFGNKNIKTLSSADSAGIRWIYPSTNPTVSSITPSSGYNNGSVSITNLTGTNFANGAAMHLTRSGYEISATGVSVISPTKITCTLPLTDVPIGQYNVVVTNPDGKNGTLANGFRVINATKAPDRIGVIRNSNMWLLDNSGNGAYGAGDLTYVFGKAGDVYVTGDWNTDGKTEVGVVRNGNTWLLDASGNGAYGAGDLSYVFGKAGDVYVTGDWNTDGKTEIGVVRNGNTWLLDASGNGAYGAGDLTYVFGKAGDTCVTGEWS